MPNGQFFCPFVKETLGISEYIAQYAACMTIITKTKDLKTLCEALAQEPFFTIDTEFLRDKTYYPQLCLIQVAAPKGEAIAIDPLADGLDLSPLYEVLANEKVVKVFHAARQDLEIFYNMAGQIPRPIFDTQVAAMVCGYGDSIGYHKLVSSICHQSLDKGAQYTDWSRRPLSDRQLSYALDDVTYLRDVYLVLSTTLEERERAKWLKEEMAVLESDSTYQNNPDESWKKIKQRSDKPRTLAILKEVAAWREIEAQRRNVPKNRIMRDETIVDMAIHEPQSIDELKRIRNISSGMAGSETGKHLLDLIQKARSLPTKDCPRLERKPAPSQELTPVIEMLKMLLRIQCSEHDVVPRLIADTSELVELAQDDNAQIPALKGWRYEIFGKDALAMKNGEIALRLKDNTIKKQEL